MSKLLLFLGLLLLLSCDQDYNLSKKEINNYVKKIDSLKNNKGLKELDFFNDQKTCDGSTFIYSLNNKVVFIESFNSGEYSKFHKRVYILDKKIYHIKYKMSIPDIDSIREKQLVFHDTIFIVYYSNKIYSDKIFNNKVIERNLDFEFLKELEECPNNLLKEIYLK